MSNATATATKIGDVILTFIDPRSAKQARVTLPIESAEDLKAQIEAAIVVARIQLVTHAYVAAASGYFANMRKLTTPIEVAYNLNSGGCGMRASANDEIAPKTNRANTRAAQPVDRRMKVISLRCYTSTCSPSPQRALRTSACNIFSAFFPPQ